MVSECLHPALGVKKGVKTNGNGRREGDTIVQRAEARKTGYASGVFSNNGWHC